MKTLLEKAVVEALSLYMKKKGIKQNELAKRLGWSPADLNDTLKGRKSIGKTRQAFIEAKLGNVFRYELLLQISDLSALQKKKTSEIAESPDEFIAGDFILTDVELKYVTRLLNILRGFNRQAQVAVKANIDALYHHSKERRKIEEKY